jgi:osmotically-inducible protein OsmY
MKTSTGRKVAIATLLTLLLAGGALTAGSARVPPPTTPQSSSCSRIDDATLANNVRDDLAKTMSARVMENIQVTAKNRVVTLNGTTNFLGTKARAGELARKVKCVRRVINKIQFLRTAGACERGQQDCCCPETGCECARICLICGNPKPGPGRHRRGRR